MEISIYLYKDGIILHILTSQLADVAFLMSVLHPYNMISKSHLVFHKLLNQSPTIGYLSCFLTVHFCLLPNKPPNVQLLMLDCALVSSSFSKKMKGACSAYTNNTNYNFKNIIHAP